MKFQKYWKMIGGLVGVIAGMAAPYLAGVEAPQIEMIILAVLTAAGVYVAPKNAD